MADLFDEPVRLHGSGRTDRGVHALRQTAHFELDARRVELPFDRWTPMLNQRLPAEVRVLSIRSTRTDFDARHSARSRVYGYRFLSRVTRRFGDHRYGWVIDGHADVEAARSAVDLLAGSVPTRVFAGRGGSTHSAERWTISAALRQLRFGDVWVLFRSRSFRYRMVRCLATAVANRMTGNWSRQQLRERMEKGKTVDAAPAAGCFLVGACYENRADWSRPWRRIIRAFKRGGLS